MKLPNAEAAVIERRKIVGYLLNAAHRYGASKARFFGAYGFHIENWERLAQALRRHGESHDVKRVKETGFGPRYQIEGRLVAPDGRSPLVRSIWQMDQGEVAPRLITAYPLED
jgi:filamentous hemagglutinin